MMAQSVLYRLIRNTRGYDNCMEAEVRALISVQFYFSHASETLPWTAFMVTKRAVSYYARVSL